MWLLGEVLKESPKALEGKDNPRHESQKEYGEDD
jgi:hypothetical protein